MGNLKETLSSDLKEAMKAKDNFKRDTIRFLMSALKQVEVDERRELSNEDIIKIIQKSIKQREDAFSQYKDAGREDLAQKEEAEANLLKGYLPKQLSDDELFEIIKEISSQIGATSIKDMGKIMPLAIAKTAGAADGKRINEAIKKVFTN